MTNIQDEKLEQAISEAVSMKEEGEPVSDILSKFPEFKNELEGVFLTMEALKESAGLVEAPKESLRFVLEKMSKEAVTNSGLNRYPYMKEQKGRVFQQIISNVHFITMNKKLVGLFVFLLIVVGGAYYWQQKEGADTASQELAATEAELNQDITDMEFFVQDTSLDSLETELAMLTENGATPLGVESASLDAFDADFAASLDTLSSDMTDLEGTANDTSLDSLDSGLSGI